MRSSLFLTLPRFAFEHPEGQKGLFWFGYIEGGVQKQSIEHRVREEDAILISQDEREREKAQ